MGLLQGIGLNIISDNENCHNKRLQHTFRMKSGGTKTGTGMQITGRKTSWSP
jgi:hypothetical protein